MIFFLNYNMIIIIIIINIIFCCRCIDRCIYLNLVKSTQSAAELKALKHAAIGRYLMCKSLPYYFHLLYRSTFILLSAKVHAGSLHVSVIHRTLTWTWSFLCVRIHTSGLGTPTPSQHNIFDSEKLTIFVWAPDGIRTSVLWILRPTLHQLVGLGSHTQSTGCEFSQSKILCWLAVCVCESSHHFWLGKNSHPLCLVL